MKAFYLALHRAFENPKILEKFTQKNINPPKLIDFYAGQDRSPEAFELLTLPALLLNWSVDYTPDTPTARLNFYLLYEQLRSTANFSLSKQKALYFFDLADLVDKVIKGLRTETTGTLRLVHEELTPEHAVAESYLLQYECPYYGNKKTQKKELLTGTVEGVQLKSKLLKGML